MSYYKHTNDTTGIASSRGEQAEIMFQNKLTKLNISWTKATEEQDKYKHHDLYISSKTNKLIGIDVKDMKHRYRSDAKPDQLYCCIEISNNYGYSWVNGTGYIAFRYNQEFLLVPRNALQQYISDNIDTKQIKIENKNRPLMDEKDLRHKLFYRDNQPREAVTYVSWDDIKQLATRIL